MKQNFKKIILRFFTVNLNWKLFSLFLSVSMWFIVMNINNPTETKTFLVNLSFLNYEVLKENDLIILNEDELKNTKVNVKVKGTRQALAQLNRKENRDSIIASLNLEQFSTTNSDSVKSIICNIDVSLPKLSYNYEISNVTPVTALISIDKVISINKDINIKKIGSLKENHLSQDISLSQDNIKIIGAKSIVNSIESVFVELDINNESSDIKKSVTPIAYDSFGNIVNNVTFEPSEITVNMPIYTKLKISILEPTLEGTPKEGYYIKDITYLPKETYIFSLDKNVKAEIKPTININNIDEDKEFSIDISNFFKDKNVIFKDDKEIKIKVNVELEKSFEIPISSIKIINNEKNYKIENENSLKITLKGNENSLKNITLESLEPYIDAKKINSNNTVNLELNLPSEVYLKEETPLSVYIDNENNLSSQNSEQIKNP